VKTSEERKREERASDGREEDRRVFSQEKKGFSMMKEKNREGTLKGIEDEDETINRPSRLVRVERGTDAEKELSAPGKKRGSFQEGGVSALVIDDGRRMLLSVRRFGGKRIPRGGKSFFSAGGAERRASTRESVFLRKCFFLLIEIMRPREIKSLMEGKISLHAIFKEA